MTQSEAERLGGLSAAEQVRLIRAGELTARENVAACLARIETRNGPLNAVTDVFADEAFAAADAVDQGESAQGPLAGVPILVKDEYDIAGHVTTLGGYGNSTPAVADAEVIRRVREAGAIIVGRTAMPEFGQFPTTESRRYGITRNPWDRTRGPGGSSGGSAVAIAAGMVAIALGADGGGSLRIPAGTCGIVGLKPTRGLVSTAPLPQHWFSLVSLGGMSRTAIDSALLLDVIAGNTPSDKWKYPSPSTSFGDQVAAGPGRLRIGWTTKSVVPGLRTDPEVAAATEELARAFAELGHEVERWTGRFPTPTDAFLPQYYAGMRVEGASVEHPERLEKRTRQTIEMSGWATQRVVDWAIARGAKEADALDEQVFATYDVLLVPTMPKLTAPARLIGNLSSLRGQAKTLPYVANTTLFNVTGHPALSIPAPPSTKGWPIGVQLVGRRGTDGRLLALASQYESQRPWPSPPSNR